MGSSQSKDQTCISCIFCIGRQIFYHLSHLESQLLLNCLLACCCFSHVWVFVTLWTITHLASLFIGVSRQEYWIGFPCFPPGELLTQGLNCISCVPCFSGRFLSTELPGKSYCWKAYSIFQCLQFLLRVLAPHLEVLLKIFFVSSWWISPLLILKYTVSVIVFSYFKVCFLTIRLPHQFFLGNKSRTYI